MRILGWTIDQIAEAKGYQGIIDGSPIEQSISGLAKLRLFWRKYRSYEPGCSPVLGINIKHDYEWAIAASVNCMNSIYCNP